MSQQATLEGIVLQRRNWRESDRIVTVLTKEIGKIDVIAKGARRTGSRLSASTEPLALSQMSIVLGRSKSYLIQSKILNTFSGIRLDYEKLTTSLAMAELYHGFTLHDQSLPDVFDLLVHSLKILENHDHPHIVFIWSSLKLMELEGVHPHWLECSVSGRSIDHDLTWISPQAGGYVSHSEAHSFSDRFRVSLEVLITLSKLSDCAEPPCQMKLVEECLNALLPIWKKVTHMQLPTVQMLISGNLTS